MRAVICEVSQRQRRLLTAGRLVGANGLVAGAVDTVVVLEVDGALVTEIYLVRNPDKLGHVTL
jgi:hypothetical protein